MRRLSDFSEQGAPKPSFLDRKLTTCHRWNGFAPPFWKSEDLGSGAFGRGIRRRAIRLSSIVKL